MDSPWGDTMSNDSYPNERKGKRSRENIATQQPTDQAFLESLVDPNFEELARQFPNFGRAYKEVKQQAVSRSFSSCITQDFSIQLTKALLHIHWGISLRDLPGHLCPPVPNRYFLIQWLQKQLLPCLCSERHFLEQRPPTNSGLDLGTGATCIYPLLFIATLRKTGAIGDWKIWASDIDTESIRLAEANIRSNLLQNYIRPIQVQLADKQASSLGLVPESRGQASHGPLRRSIEAISHTHNNQPVLLDFCLTNPPFYDIDSIEPRQGDGRSRTAMTASEGTYPLGEIGFCSDILLDECLLFSNNEQELVPGWTVVMCGKKTSFITLHHWVTQILGSSHVCGTEFGPGQLTRWFLAWTWLRKPSAKSPLASQETWDVAVPNVQRAEILERIAQYAQEYSLLMRRCSEGLELWENSSVEQRVNDWALDDKYLPPHLQSLVGSLSSEVRHSLLPEEGHFLLVVKAKDSFLQIQAFAHTSFGKRKIAHIKLQLAGEIARTNRKWRRKLRRQQQQEEGPPDASMIDI